MVGRFFKNITYMSFGTFFQFFIAFLSTAIYIRVIGTSGYAILGIVFSLINIFIQLDMPFKLTLVKHNLDYYGKQKDKFELMFSTLYSSILISNLIILPLLFLLSIFLSIIVYKDSSLIPFYSIAILVLIMNRVNIFLKHFLRANRNEIIIQKSYIPAITLEFLSSVTLLLVFNLGVMSIFIGALLRNLLEYFLLRYYSGGLIKHRAYFSLELFANTFRKHIFHNHIQNILYDLMLYGGLFVSTFYLNVTSLGILTIIISILRKFRELFFPLSIHLWPIFSYAILKKMHGKIKEIIKNITFLLIVFNIIIALFLLLIGKPLYSLYFGSKMNGTYFLFLLMMFGILLNTSLNAVRNYFFVLDIKLLNKINIVLITIFFIALIPIIKALGILGMALAFFAINIIKLPIMYFFLYEKHGKVIDNDTFMLFIILIVSMAVTLLIHGNNLSFVLIILPSILILLLGFLLNIKKIIKMIKFIVFEI